MLWTLDLSCENYVVKLRDLLKSIICILMCCAGPCFTICWGSRLPLPHAQSLVNSDKKHSTSTDFSVSALWCWHWMGKHPEKHYTNSSQWQSLTARSSLNHCKWIDMQEELSLIVYWYWIVESRIDYCTCFQLLFHVYVKCNGRE